MMKTTVLKLTVLTGLIAVCLFTARRHRLVISGFAPPLGQAASAAVLLASRPKRRRAERRIAAFSRLGRRLSAVRTPKEAAEIILDTADVLCGWDACFLDLCPANATAVTSVLCIDTVNGQRTKIVPDSNRAELTAMTRRVFERGAQLILRPPPLGFSPEMRAFGDKTHPSASLLYVPIRKDASMIGLLSIQSYTPNAYTKEDLQTLQALADHCGGALERIRAETALSESDERLRLALAASRMGTWTRELEGGDQILSSPELDAILGLQPGEFAGTEAALYAFVHQEDRELVRRAFALALESGKDYEVEFRFLPRNRPVGWMLGRGRAYYNAEGKPIRLAGVAIDITARKEAEQEVSRLNAELEKRVRARTRQLEAMNRELEAFAYSVSHDLRAPLRSIRGFSEVLLEGHAAQLDSVGQDCLRRTCESSQHMERLIDDLLKLSRVGRNELRWQLVDLSRLAESLADELRKADPGREVEFVIAPHLHAEGDQRLLRLALENLMRNAWKFTSKKPLAKIEFGLAIEPEQAFFVRDNGVGFDTAYADKLFGVFQRLHSASEFPGTGVGLATVQRIVNRHFGRVWATAVANQGATFYFTLPGRGGYEL
jgi:PAS domain S-box-containing protein